MKVLTVVGARPQFIKASPVSRALHSAGHQEFLVHTGQHYDYGMSQVFFDELRIPAPDVNLNIGSASHGRQTGEMLARIEEQMLQQAPDRVLVYGDTNSTLAGALAACKLNLPLAHVEAGVRSFNRTMPEEHNRVLTDHCADYLFCPTTTAVENLRREGIVRGVHCVGDTMYEEMLQSGELASRCSQIMDRLLIQPKGYLLVTIHRPATTDNPENLQRILSALVSLQESVVFPVHPRTRRSMKAAGLDALLPGASNILAIDPVGYFDMLALEQNARRILTDSGGVQKEAYFFHVPCITLREETEWIETVDTGWNTLVGLERDRLLRALTMPSEPKEHPQLFGDGRSSKRIVEELCGP